MFDNAEALEVVRLMRPFLTKILGSEIGLQADRELASILNQADLDEDERVDRILAIVDSRSETKAWFDNYLEMQSSRVVRGFSGLAGSPDVQPAVKYACPHNDYTWYQEDGNPIPLCPTHLEKLIPAQS
jgi:hypothetical protein